MGSKKEKILEEVRPDMERLHKLAADIAELDKSAGTLFEDLETGADEAPEATLFCLALILSGAQSQCEKFIKHCRE